MKVKKVIKKKNIGKVGSPPIATEDYTQERR